MARQPRKAGAAETRTPAEALRWSGVPWLSAAQRQVASARREGRLPHAILLHGTAGSGQSALALWTAQLILCDESRDQPCGHCSSCALFLAGNHPDFHLIEVEEKASYIKVDQIRELCSKLGMRSYRGTSKVAVIDPVDRMNASSNNALLKTLEEPPENTVLVLAATRTDRLPRTVVSRCQRVRIAAPDTADALDWLRSQAAREDWPDLLALAGGAPLQAVELAASGAGELLEEMTHAMAGAVGATFDALGLADAWSRDRPAERLAWLECWLETRIRRAASVSDAVNNNRDNALPSSAPELNIRIAFGLLDRVRQARGFLEGSLNSLLLFEDLLVDFAEACGGAAALRAETQG